MDNVNFSENDKDNAKVPEKCWKFTGVTLKGPI